MQRGEESTVGRSLTHQHASTYLLANKQAGVKSGPTLGTLQKQVQEGQFLIYRKLEMIYFLFLLIC